MDDLYKVGERAAQEAGGGDALADLLAGGGDLEEYLQSYEQMLSEGFATENPQLNQVDAEGGITVRPDPGFVVKTRDTQTGQKVFINVVSNEHVEAPHVQSLADADGEEGVRVPLSVGTPVEDFDKKNEPCVTYDLVANPETVEECTRTPAFRESVVMLCLHAVSQKYKIELDSKYKLPKMKYKGNTVQLQRIRKKQVSKIEEVSSTAPVPGQAAADRLASAKKSEATDGGLKRPEFCVFYAKPAAPRLDGFSHKWGLLIDENQDYETMLHLNSLDLPCYRVCAWKENIRGTMMNQADRERQLSELQGAEAADVQTHQVLKGRICVAQVRMPDLDRHVAALKQFKAEVSDECLHIAFPLLPRSGRAVYAPLTIWWPFPFCSAQATAEWSTDDDTLIVTLPVDAPAEADAFDQELLDAVF
mmetsp:Transcript_85459/g.160987  ORF Transcript_85459/g.160987 Transcript_85459/m.160987 type:complete len:419 (+) Transcript_85459:232-1488(+)